ncbi:MAG: metallophosphoesterase [Deltaproteobacteria bacterium]|nr:metallophosphoesterase [Deltaproteobacteria bacterium]
MASILRLAILLVLVFYVWHRLARRTSLKGAVKIAVTVGLLITIAPMAWVMATGPNGAPKTTGAFAWPAFIGWSLFALTFAGLLITDLVWLIVWSARKIGRKVAGKSTPADPSRRQAIARITGGLVGAAVVGEVGYGLTRALGDAEIVDVPVVLKRLPPALDGFTIAQLTDIHVGGTIGRAFIEELVERTNAIGADIIVLTGDFVDGSVDEPRDAFAPFALLKAPHGVYFVTGNHEYYSGAAEWVAHIASLGIRVLRNERVAIERAGSVFDLAGIDDHGGRKFYPDHGPDLVRTMAGRDPQRAVVMLAHQPRQVHQVAKHDVDLQLSGHTHGGQVWPWHYLVSIQQGGLLAGRYQIGATQLYVSRGAGYWGPPVRVGAPPEITRVILRSSGET